MWFYESVASLIVDGIEKSDVRIKNAFCIICESVIATFNKVRDKNTLILFDMLTYTCKTFV